MLVTGDLNATPTQDAPAVLARLGLIDELHLHGERPTFRGTSRRIDYIMADEMLDREVTGGGIVDTAVSDHVPVYVDFAPRDPG
jgi:endonuclease/exonuclease/phosphatase (EEP) superfamily protein YafD